MAGPTQAEEPKVTAPGDCLGRFTRRKPPPPRHDHGGLFGGRDRWLFRSAPALPAWKLALRKCGRAPAGRKRSLATRDVSLRRWAAAPLGATLPSWNWIDPVRDLVPALSRPERKLSKWNGAPFFFARRLQKLALKLPRSACKEKRWKRRLFSFAHKLSKPARKPFFLGRKLSKLARKL